MEKTWTVVGTCQLLRAGTATSPTRATFYQAHGCQKTTSQAWNLFSYPNPQFSLDWRAQGYMMLPLLAILLPTARVNAMPCLSLSSALERQSWSPWDAGDNWPQGTPKHWNSSPSKMVNLSMLGFFAPCFHCQAGEQGFTIKSHMRSHCRVTKPL